MGLTMGLLRQEPVGGRHAALPPRRRDRWPKHAAKDIVICGCALLAASGDGEPVEWIEEVWHRWCSSGEA
jgi:hypothetical protein